MKSWGWLAHDGETFGRQNLLDERMNISTSWVKSEDHHGDWAARVEINEGDTSNGGPDAPPAGGTFFVYFANQDGRKIDIQASGTSESLERGDAQFAQTCSFRSDSWCAYVQSSGTNAADVAVNYISANTDHFHNLTDFVKSSVYRSVLAQYKAGKKRLRLALPDAEKVNSNLGIIQVTGYLPLSFDVVFLSEGSDDSESSTSRRDRLSGSGLSAILKERELKFDEKFRSKFAIESPDVALVAKASLSNMLGGIGYWYGHSMVRIQDPSKGEKVLPLWDAPLYSGTPSRSFFPRGFLWDEGFHQVRVVVG